LQLYLDVNSTRITLLPLVGMPSRQPLETLSNKDAFLLNLFLGEDHLKSLGIDEKNVPQATHHPTEDAAAIATLHRLVYLANSK